MMIFPNGFVLDTQKKKDVLVGLNLKIKMSFKEFKGNYNNILFLY